MEMSTGVDNMKLLFCRRIRDSTGESNKENDTQKTAWLSTTLICKGAATGHAFSFNDDETTLGCWTDTQPLCQSKPMWSCTSTSTMNDNKCSTCVCFGLTVEEYQQHGNPRFETASWQPQGRRQLASTDWQCHHQG